MRWLAKRRGLGAPVLFAIENTEHAQATAASRQVSLVKRLNRPVRVTYQGRKESASYPGQMPALRA